MAQTEGCLQTHPSVVTGSRNPPIPCADQREVDPMMSSSAPHEVHDRDAVTAAFASNIPKPYLMLWWKPAALTVHPSSPGSVTRAVDARMPCTSRYESHGLA